MYRSCSGRHEDSSSEFNPSMRQAVQEIRATMKSLSESSQVSSSLAFMDVIVILLTVSRDHKKGKLQSGPPCEGGPERAMGKQEGQGAASKHAIVDNKPNRGSTPLVS